VENGTIRFHIGKKNLMFQFWPTKSRKNGYALAVCPQPAAVAPILRRLPQPSSHSGRQGHTDDKGCTATKRRLPVFPFGLQWSGSDDPGLVPNPRLGTSVLQTRWSGNTG
jgi:hypothetical protein